MRVVKRNPFLAAFALKIITDKDRRHRHGRHNRSNQNHDAMARAGGWLCLSGDARPARFPSFHNTEPPAYAITEQTPLTQMIKCR